ANSAAVLRHGLGNDWVRAGILCYGSAPDFPAHDIQHWGLQPTMTLRSRLIAVQQLQAGDTVGYGSSYTASAPQRIGIVACGYADGYPRHCGTDTPVLVDGVRTGTVGRVSMDMLAVDLTPVPACGIGSEVTLWGRGPGDTLLAIDDVARAGGTIGYELMCALAPRVPVSAID
ncbi:MAG: alanine racemase, partial [Rubrivivax sp.]|nr:alanine racemase [Rubrivivax sp.]